MVQLCCCKPVAMPSLFVKSAARIFLSTVTDEGFLVTIVAVVVVVGPSCLRRV